MRGRAPAPLLLAGLLAGCAASADPAPAFAPTGAVRLVAEGGGYVVEATTAGADSLYLLQTEGDQIRVVFPPGDRAWMATGGTERVVPQPPSAQPDDEPLAAWHPDPGQGRELLLVATPSPREGASDQTMPLERFLAPPPYVRGPLAAPGVVIDRAPIP